MQTIGCVLQTTICAIAKNNFPLLSLIFLLHVLNLKFYLSTSNVFFYIYSVEFQILSNLIKWISNLLQKVEVRSSSSLKTKSLN